MKKKLLYLGWLIYRDILYSGIDGTISKEQTKKIIRMNQFVVLALLVNFFSVKSNAGNHIFIKSDGKLIRLNNDDILFIESMGDYVKFVTRDKKYVTYNSIKNLEEKVNKDYFMRVHRSYIINLLKIDDIRENDLFINGIEIPISKNLRADVLKRLTIL